MALFRRRLRSPKGWNELTSVIIDMQEALEAWAAHINPVIIHKQDRLIPGEGITIDGDTISVERSGGDNGSYPVPARCPANVNDSVSFEITVSGASYQWQYSSTGASWAATTLTGNKTQRLTVSATAARHKNQYRCKVTMEDGSVVYTDPVMLFVVPAV